MTSAPAARPPSLDLRCPSCGAAAFEVRVQAEEGVAAARCTACNRNHLVLDSEDYWFDVIQSAMPRIRRCTCRAAAFALSCHYEYRTDGDVRRVELRGACTSCSKARSLMSVDIDYGDTADLVDRPLHFCATPDLRYDLREATLYATPSDIAGIVAYLADAHGWTFACWRREEGHWVPGALDAAAACDAVLAERYLHIYASPALLDIRPEQVETARLEAAYWKRHDVVRLSSATHMRFDRGAGYLYYLKFANEYIDGGAVAPKSPPFRAATAALISWLGERFVSWRGKNCFDNADEHRRLFGERFTDGRRR